jgi:flagellar motor switch/type III secretory pathway protein FliN
VREAVNDAAARPFPWGSLDATTRQEVQALRLVRRWAAAHTDLGRLPAVLGEMLGTEVAVLLRRAEPWTPGRALVTGAAVLLAAAGERGVGRAALVEAEGPLVTAVVRRTMRRPSPSGVDPGGLLPASAIGAFAAVVAASARRAHQGLALQVLAAGPPSSLEADLARGGDALFAVTLTVLVEHDAFDARVVVPQRAALAAPSLPWNDRTLAALGATPLGLPLVACAFRATATDVAWLGEGDVLVPAAWPLGREGAALEGPVWLAAPAADVGVRARLVPGGRLVLGGALEPLVADDAEANMASDTGASTGPGIDKAELIDAIGDVPVLVRVELGEARMAAREWAAVGKGDVVTLGRRVGEAVLIRVGGVPVARGDLVEVDGEVGVRIVERLTGDGGTP